MEDFYQILGVEENADISTIKKKYRELSKIYHPDRNPEGEEMFKKISNAYETLSDDNKRKEYDFRRKNPFAGQGGGGDLIRLWSSLDNKQDLNNKQDHNKGLQSMLEYWMRTSEMKLKSTTQEI